MRLYSSHEWDESLFPRMLRIQYCGIKWDIRSLIPIPLILKKGRKNGTDLISRVCLFVKFFFFFGCCSTQSNNFLFAWIYLLLLLLLLLLEKKIFFFVCSGRRTHADYILFSLVNFQDFYLLFKYLKKFSFFISLPSSLPHSSLHSSLFFFSSHVRFRFFSWNRPFFVIP